MTTDSRFLLTRFAPTSPSLADQKQSTRNLLILVLELNTRVTNVMPFQAGVCVILATRPAATLLRSQLWEGQPPQFWFWFKASQKNKTKQYFSQPRAARLCQSWLKQFVSHTMGNMCKNYNSLFPQHSVISWVWHQIVGKWENVELAAVFS